jgi:hypothetical protein
MIKLRYALTILFFVVALCPVSNSLADTFPRCFIGTYLLEQGSGTMSLWTFGARGTIIVTSSAQEELNFSTEQGSWKKSARSQAKSTMLDFSFGEDGELINIARVDATINFLGSNCDEVEGSFSLRFFDNGQDPLNPDNSNGDTITDTFTGRRVKTE